MHSGEGNGSGSGTRTKGGRRQAEHISVLVGFRESGPWWLLRGMGRLSTIELSSVGVCGFAGLQ